MILLDPKSTQPIEKSHDWLDVDSNGIWRLIKDFSYLPYHIVRMLHIGSQALFDGEKMIVYDRDYYQYLVVFDEYDYTTRTFAYGVSIEVLDNGNIIMQTETDLYCVDRSLNDVWHLSRTGRGSTWLDRENNILYSTQSTSIDAIDPNTGTILKSGSLPYGDFAVIKIGDYIYTPRRNTNKTFDLDLNLVADNYFAGGYANVLPTPKLAGNGYWIGSYGIGYYPDVVFARFDVNPSGTFVYSYLFPMKKSLGRNQYRQGEIFNYDRIGTRHNKYWAFVKDNAIQYTQSKFGYVPVAEEISITYSINISDVITAISVDNTTTVVNINDQTSEDFYYYHVFVSKDKQNWTEVQNMQDISNLNLNGTVFIKLVWNPESFTMPVLKPIGIWTEPITTPPPQVQYDAINVETTYNSPDDYPASRIASPAPNSYRPETFVDMKVQLDQGNGLKDYTGELYMRVRVYELHGEGGEDADAILVEERTDVITVPSNVRIGASNGLTPTHPANWQGYKIFYNLDTDTGFDLMNDALIATLYRNDINYVVEEYVDVPQDRANHEAKELNVRAALRKQLVEVLEATGIYALVYKKKNTGPHCPDCWDEHYGRRTKEQCTTCFNTGYAGGYYSPYELRLRILSEQLTIAHSDENIVPINQDAVQLLLPVYPILDREDVIIIPVRGEILRVEQAQLNSNKTQQMVLASTITPADIRYIHFKEILKNQS